MSEPIESEAEERERWWQANREAGRVNTISPHSGIIDPRTIPGLQEDHGLMALFDAIVKRREDAASGDQVPSNEEAML